MRHVKRKGKGEKIGREWEELGGSGEGAGGSCSVVHEMTSLAVCHTHKLTVYMTVALNFCTGCHVGYGGFLQVWWRASLYIPHHRGTCQPAPLWSLTCHAQHGTTFLLLPLTWPLLLLTHCTPCGRTVIVHGHPSSSSPSSSDCPQPSYSPPVQHPGVLRESSPWT